MNARTDRGSILFVALITLAALAVMAAFTFERLAPSLRTAYQTAAWQEARLAAESGADAAVGELLRNETGEAPDTWEGWRTDTPNGPAPVPPGSIKSLLTVDLSAILDLLAGPGAPAPSSPPQQSEPIYLDNLRISAASGAPAEVDVKLWALRPTDAGSKPWFRIRSMATCAVPRSASNIPRFDAFLRRFSFHSKRPRVQEDDAGAPSTVPLPNVSRTIEVLVEPITPFELALWTDHSLSLPLNGTWCVDAYDSRDAAKSNPDGTYPGKESAKIADDAVIALNRGRPGDALIGPLIDAHDARVRGVVATNGGDDTSTPGHENVAGMRGIDGSRVRDDFAREMLPVPRPGGATPLPPPLPGLPFVPGTRTSPAFYHVTGTLGGFSVAPPSGGGWGALVILIDGDLSTADGPIVIPPNVAAEIYVRGHVNFWGQQINSGAGSSNRPAQLLIFGESSANQRQLLAQDSARIHAAFYGPTYDVSLHGSVEWFGSVAGRSFSAPVGGDGGIHYDRALALLGPPVSFRVVRYIEDVRQ